MIYMHSCKKIFMKMSIRIHLAATIDIWPKLDIIESTNSKSKLQYNIGHIIFTYKFIPRAQQRKVSQDHQPLSDVTVMSTEKIQFRQSLNNKVANFNSLR